MIDWGSVGANALWIFGCALALALLSYASWRSATSKKNWRHFLQLQPLVNWLRLAGISFCAGLALTANSVFEIALWAGLGLLFLYQLLYSQLHRVG